MFYVYHCCVTTDNWLNANNVPFPDFPTESVFFLQPPMIRNNELGDSVLLFYNFFRDNPEGTPFSAIKIGFTSNLEAITVGGLMLKGCYEKGAHATTLAKWRPFCPGEDPLDKMAAISQTTISNVFS